MAKPIECPKCGGNTPIKLAADEYKCAYCDSIFHIKAEKQRNTPLDDGNERPFVKYVRQMQAQGYDPAKAAKKVRVFVFGFVFLMIGIGVTVSLITMNSVNEQITQITSGIPQTDGWQQPTVNRFYVYEGSKGPVIWSVIQQTKQGLDSARFYISLTDPVTEKEMTTRQILTTMTWDESFHFSDMWGELAAFGDTVWIGSDANGIHGRDLYTGEIVADEKYMANKFPELKKGVSKATNQDYRKVFELLTDDGFTFLFLPNEMKIMKEDEFNDNKQKVFKTFYIITEENRPYLLRIREEIEKYRYNPRTFIHDPENFFKNKNRNNRNDAEVDSVRTKEPLFGVKILWSDDESVMVLYRETLKKDSEAHITLLNKDGSEKWDIPGKKLDGFSKVFSDEMYFNTSSNGKEVALYHTSAKKLAIGIDIKTGKVNWSFEE